MENSGETDLETPTSQLVGIGNNAEIQRSVIGSRMLKKLLTPRLAWLVVGVELVLIVGAAYFDHLSRPMPSQQAYWEAWQAKTLYWNPWYIGLISTIPNLAFLIIGLLIVIRLPGKRYGWVLIVFGFAFGGWMNFFDSYGVYLYYLYITAGGALWKVGMAVYLSGIGWITGFASLVFILLLYPTGRYLSHRWRIVGSLALLSLVFDISFAAFNPGGVGFIADIENPFGLNSFLGRAMSISIIASVVVMAVCIFLSVLSVILRFFRSEGVERQQIKWFTFAAFLMGLYLIIDGATEMLQPWETVKEALFLALLPLAIGIAILRYRLYDIDLIIRRTLQYTLLTGLLVLVYLGSILVLQTLVENLTGQQSPIVIVISTLAIAALFNPLRLRVQAFIDRRFYRRKYDAEQALAWFAATARDEVDLDDLQNQILTVVEDTLQPESLSLWLMKKTK